MKKYKLPKEFATKWVEALRSGKYVPYSGLLIKDGCYCALGVAGLVAGIPTEKMKGHGGFWEQNEDIYLNTCLPKQLTGWKDGGLDKVIAFYSDEHANFNEVADWIEANVEFI